MRIDVVALWKVYVLKQVAANRLRWNGVAVHLDSFHMRNRSFHRHQPLAQIFINAWSGVGFCHKNPGPVSITPGIPMRELSVANSPLTHGVPADCTRVYSEHIDGTGRSRCDHSGASA